MPAARRIVAWVALGAVAVDEYLKRPDAPPVVLDERAWGMLRDQIGPSIVELDRVRVRAWKMHIVRRADAPAVESAAVSTTR